MHPITLGRPAAKLSGVAQDATRPSVCLIGLALLYGAMPKKSHL